MTGFADPISVIFSQSAQLAEGTTLIQDNAFGQVVKQGGKTLQDFFNQEKAMGFLMAYTKDRQGGRLEIAAQALLKSQGLIALIEGGHAKELVDLFYDFSLENVSNILLHDASAVHFVSAGHHEFIMDVLQNPDTSKYVCERILASDGVVKILVDAGHRETLWQIVKNFELHEKAIVYAAGDAVWNLAEMDEEKAQIMDDLNKLENMASLTAVLSANNVVKALACFADQIIPRFYEMKPEQRANVYCADDAIYILFRDNPAYVENVMIDLREFSMKKRVSVLITNKVMKTLIDNGCEDEIMEWVREMNQKEKRTFLKAEETVIELSKTRHRGEIINMVAEENITLRDEVTAALNLSGQESAQLGAQPQ